MSYTPRLKEKYTNEIVPVMKEKFQYKSLMEVPKVEKIVISQGVGEAVSDRKLIENAVNDLTEIAGQKALIVNSKKDVSNFKLREGMPVGIKVTLRGNVMWDFLLRLIAISLPNIRDFRGVPAKLDGSGNYTLGIIDHSIFPEINVERQRTNTGLDISIVTSANNDADGSELLKLLGMPFRKNSSDSSNQQEAA